MREACFNVHVCKVCVLFIYRWARSAAKRPALLSTFGFRAHSYVYKPGRNYSLLCTGRSSFQLPKTFMRLNRMEGFRQPGFLHLKDKAANTFAEVPSSILA